MAPETILSAVNNQVWAILPSKLDEIETVVKARIRGESADTTAFEAFAALRQARVEAAEQETDPVRALYKRMGVQVNESGVALVPVQGTMMKRLNMFSEISGGVSTSMLAQTVRTLHADRSVRGVVFAVDSPGGSVEGLSELRQAIRALSVDKPTHAVADDMMASAAYFTFSAARKVSGTPDALIGSIGTLAARWDYSDAYAEAGIKRHIWRSGRYKALGQVTEPLSEDESNDTQQMVDSYFSIFVDAVAENRNINHEEAMALADGRVYVGAETPKHMADSTTTVEEAVQDMTEELTLEDRLALSEERRLTAEDQVKTMTAELADLRAQIAAFEAEREAAALAQKEERADRFIADLVTEGKIAPMSDTSALRASLVADFDGASSMWALVPARAAAPTEMQPSEAATPFEEVEARIAEAQQKGIPVAEDEAAAEVYEALGREYVKGY